jgi:hypothetical protein
MKIIELLDGSTWDMDTVLAKMQDDSFYYGNLSKNALSSSACKLLLTSPKPTTTSPSTEAKTLMPLP